MLTRMAGERGGQSAKEWPEAEGGGGGGGVRRRGGGERKEKGGGAKKLAPAPPGRGEADGGGAETCRGDAAQNE